MLDVAAGRLTRAEWLKRRDLHRRLELYGRCAWHAALQARRCWKAAADVPAMDEEVWPGLLSAKQVSPSHEVPALRKEIQHLHETPSMPINVLVPF